MGSLKEMLMVFVLKNMEPEKSQSGLWSVTFPAPEINLATLNPRISLNRQVTEEYVIQCECVPWFS